MRKFVIFAILVVIGALFVSLITNSTKTTRQPSKDKIGKVGDTKSNMEIISTAFSHNSKIPVQHTCDGKNISPPLEFTDVPEDAKSLVLIVDDPDAPAKTWAHWVVYNISAEVTEVGEDSIPEGGIEGVTDFGRPGYGGPCPPSGTHRYFFKLYALDTTLDLPKNSSKQMVESKMQGHVLDKADLIGLYGRD